MAEKTGRIPPKQHAYTKNAQGTDNALPAVDLREALLNLDDSTRALLREQLEAQKRSEARNVFANLADRLPASVVSLLTKAAESLDPAKRHQALVQLLDGMSKGQPTAAQKRLQTDGEDFKTSAKPPRR